MPHSKYLWNQMWITFTQATTGYGESVPVTHIGRFAAVLAFHVEYVLRVRVCLSTHTQRPTLVSRGLYATDMRNLILFTVSLPLIRMHEHAR